MDWLGKKSDKKCEIVDQSLNFDKKRSKKSKTNKFLKLANDITDYFLTNYIKIDFKLCKILKTALIYVQPCKFCRKVGHREKNCWKKSKTKLKIKNQVFALAESFKDVKLSLSKKSKMVSEIKFKLEQLKKVNKNCFEPKSFVSDALSRIISDINNILIKLVLVEFG